LPGVILSIAVYDGWGNFVVLIVAAFSFVLGALGLDGVDRRAASRFFVAASILGAIFANFVWYLSGKGPSLSVRGTSGVTMTSIGLAFMLSLTGLLVLAVKDIKLHTCTKAEKFKWRRANWPATYVSFTLALIAMVIAWYALWYSTGNNIIHGVSLSCGILASTIYFLPKLKHLPI